MTEKRKKFLTFAQFKQVVAKAKITSHPDYLFRYKKISDKIPCHPQRIYKKKWKGWTMFTGNSPRGKLRKTICCYNKAKALIEKYNVKTATEYKATYKKISEKLPSSPHQFYKEFTTWDAFLQKKSKRKTRGKMKTKFSFTIDGIPESWRRAGINRKNCSVYDTNKAYKKRVWSVIKEHQKDNHPNPDLYNSMVKIKMVFYMPIPRYAKKRNLTGTPYCKAPDLDNLTKLVLDIFTKYIIHDDRQVVELSAKKEYSDRPRTEVEYEALIESTEISSDAKLSKQNKIFKFPRPKYATSSLSN